MGCVIGKKHPSEGNIWTTFTESVDTLKFYCSSSEGNDTTGTGLTPESPKRTVAAVIALRTSRDTKPDWIFFKRGDTWTDELVSSSVLKNGRSADEPLRIDAYGDESLPRPKMKVSRGATGATAWIFDNGNAIAKNDYLAVRNIHCVNYKRDPDDPGWDASATAIGLIASNQPILWRLIEGCKLQTATIVHQRPGGAAFAAVGPTGVIYMRNNVFHKMWAPTPSATTATYVFGTASVVTHNNYYDRNNWWQYVGEYGTIDSFPPNNGMSHSYYQQTNCGPGEHHNNFISRSIDNHYRTGGVISGCMAADCTAGFVLQEGETDPANTLILVGRRSTGMTVSNMVVLYAVDGGLDTRADGMIVYACDGGTVDNVVFAHTNAATGNRPSGILLASQGGNTNYSCLNVHVTNVVGYNIQTGNTTVADAVQIAGGCTFTNITEDKPGLNTYNLINPDNGTLEGYAATQLGVVMTREELYDLLAEQREGNWRHELATYSIVPWILQQYQPVDDWIRCNANA